MFFPIPLSASASMPLCDPLTHAAVNCLVSNSSTTLLKIHSRRQLSPSRLLQANCCVG
uniref:Uncharacterized protein n=1 Tax=Anguilla anguilla TaxID=7936 RepID=A0A0E9WAN2_ANGAN